MDAHDLCKESAVSFVPVATKILECDMLHRGLSNVLEYVVGRLEKRVALQELHVNAAQPSDAAAVTFHVPTKRAPQLLAVQHHPQAVTITRHAHTNAPMVTHGGRMCASEAVKFLTGLG